MPRKKLPPQWFPMYVSNRHIFKSIPDEDVGRAVKYALQYFISGEEPPESLSPLTRVAFDALRSAADEAVANYETAVENGRKGPVAREARRLEARRSEADD